MNYARALVLSILMLQTSTYSIAAALVLPINLANTECSAGGILALALVASWNALIYTLDTPPVPSAPILWPPARPSHQGPGCYSIIGLRCSATDCTDSVFDRLCTYPDISKLMAIPTIKEACKGPISITAHNATLQACVDQFSKRPRCYSAEQVEEIAPDFCRSIPAPVPPTALDDHRKSVQAKIAELTKNRTGRQT